MITASSYLNKMGKYKKDRSLNKSLPHGNNYPMLELSSSLSVLYIA